MNIQFLKCPECDGNVDLKDGQKIQYCPYCGTKLYIDDGTRTINYNEKKEYQDKTHLDEMKLQHQWEEEKRLRFEAEQKRIDDQCKKVIKWGLIITAIACTIGGILGAIL